MPLSIYSMCTVLHMNDCDICTAIGVHWRTRAGECEQAVSFCWEIKCNCDWCCCLPLLQNTVNSVVHFILTSVGFIVTAKMPTISNQNENVFTAKEVSEKEEEPVHKFYIYNTHQWLFAFVAVIVIYYDPMCMRANDRNNVRKMSLIQWI